MAPFSRGEAGRRVLLVEPDAGRRELLSLILSRLHHRVLPASTALEALATLARAPVDLALAHGLLPDDDGAGLVRRVRAAPGDRAGTPVVIYGVDDEGGRRCRDAGADAALPRPLALDRLLREVRRLALHPERSSMLDTAPVPVVDLDRLGQFTEGDPRLEQELASLFLAGAEIYLAQLEAAIARGDAEAWRSAAHALKGSAANLGAGPITVLAAAAEHGGPSRAVLVDLREAADEARRFFALRPGFALPGG